MKAAKDRLPIFDQISIPLQNKVHDDEKASFLPEISGVYRFQLVAFDGQLYGPPDDVRVVVNDLNRVPTADAGEDQTVLVESTVSLDGSGSTDPEEDPLLNDDPLLDELNDPDDSDRFSKLLLVGTE